MNIQKLERANQLLNIIGHQEKVLNNLAILENCIVKKNIEKNRFVSIVYSSANAELDLDVAKACVLAQKEIEIKKLAELQAEFGLL